MPCLRFSILASTVMVLLVVRSVPVAAEEVWTVRDGFTTLTVDAGTLETLGLSAHIDDRIFTSDNSAMEVGLEPGSDLTITVVDGNATELIGRHIRFVEGITLVSRDGAVTVFDLVIVDGLELGASLQEAVPTLGDVPYLELERVKMGFDPGSGR
ncbi:MAG: hypothetical protein IID43_01460, partial [Planctomycetes bacterium]|nr:hypothetical protein [Planctomycetota bacterium]